MIRVRINFDGLRRKISVAKAEIPKAAEETLRALGGEAVELVRAAPVGDARRFVAKQVARQLDSVFIPVTLKHERREMWPNLREIYQARIIRGQSTYRGRKLFWVDENKRAALAAELIALAVTKRAKDRYEVRFASTYNGRFRVEIVRHGRGRIPPTMIAYARQRMRYVAADTLALALGRAGLTNGRSTTRHSHIYTTAGRRSPGT